MDRAGTRRPEGARRGGAADAWAPPTRTGCAASIGRLALCGLAAGFSVLASAAVAAASPKSQVVVAPIPASAQVPPSIAQAFDARLRAHVARQGAVVDPGTTDATIEAVRFPETCDGGACAEALGAALDVRFVLTASVANSDGIYTVALALLDRATQQRTAARAVCELCAVEEVDGTLAQAVAGLATALKAPAVAVEVTLGADADIGRMAAEVERQQAEAARALAQVQATLAAQAERDFEAIRRLVEAPSEAGRPVLEAYVQKYGEARVRIGAEEHALEVPQVALVRAALGGVEAAPAEPEPAVPAGSGSAAAAPGSAAAAGAPVAGPGSTPPTHAAETGSAQPGSTGSGSPEPASAGPSADNPAGIEWIRLEGGAFSMGSRRGDSDELPERTVQVPGFWLAKSPVTVDQYSACVAAKACSAPDADDGCNGRAPGREQHPINCVDWAQAEAFARWAGGRLPSEAEWEFAARSGGRPQEYPWGNAEPNRKHAVYEDWDRDTTAPVCSKPAGASAQGLCDLAGNVWEWVADGYGPYGEAPTDGSARRKSTGLRVIRGGSWDDPARALRATLRDGRAPEDRESDLGFRVAKDDLR